MSNLRIHAMQEMDIAGVDKDIYGDMTYKAVLELIDTFSKQGHSGASAGLVLSLFTKLVRYENLTPLTNNPSEWTGHSPDKWDGVNEVWQNKRNSEAFSSDGGKTYYLLSTGKDHIYTAESR